MRAEVSVEFGEPVDEVICLQATPDGLVVVECAAQEAFALEPAAWWALIPIGIVLACHLAPWIVDRWQSYLYSDPPGAILDEDDAERFGDAMPVDWRGDLP